MAALWPRGSLQYMRRRATQVGVAWEREVVVHADIIRKNYSKIGAALIEKLYSNDYLSIGGSASTDALAEIAGLSRTSRVLDIGSGLGGPAPRMAERYGCRVTGLDLVETNVAEANRRAQQRGLDSLVTFQTGDATEIQFESGAFDVVWGQDAWCHIPDKPQLIANCARLLGQGGTIAFTDWVETGDMEDALREELHEATASKDMATVAQYCELLERNGFSITERADISASFVDQYRGIIDKLKSLESEITGAFGSKVYGIMLEKNGAILRGFENGHIGGGRIVAVRWTGD